LYIYTYFSIFCSKWVYYFNQKQNPIRYRQINRQNRSKWCIPILSQPPLPFATAAIIWGCFFDVISLVILHCTSPIFSFFIQSNYTRGELFVTKIRERIFGLFSKSQTLDLNNDLNMNIDCVEHTFNNSTKLTAMLPVLDSSW
jgi:hypothetical protein